MSAEAKTRFAIEFFIFLNLAIFGVKELWKAFA